MVTNGIDIHVDENIEKEKYKIITQKILPEFQRFIWFRISMS